MLNEWYGHIIGVQSRINVYIPVEAEWYLVNMLATRTELEEWPTIAYAQLATSDNIICDLRRLADSGLIMPSMFPERCNKLNIPLNYYYSISYTCFDRLEHKEITENFHTIKLIMQNILQKS
jgi:hypothetical protein